MKKQQQRPGAVQTMPSRQELSAKLVCMHRRAQQAEARIEKAVWWLKAVRGDRSLILNEAFAVEALNALEGGKQ